jgi:hypothetical protein
MNGQAPAAQKYATQLPLAITCLEPGGGNLPSKLRGLPPGTARYALCTSLSPTGCRHLSFQPLPAARGIVVESPQELHKQFRGLGAESPVFRGVAAKNAPYIS